MFSLGSLAIAITSAGLWIIAALAVGYPSVITDDPLNAHIKIFSKFMGDSERVFLPFLLMTDLFIDALRGSSAWTALSTAGESDTKFVFGIILALIICYVTITGVYAAHNPKGAQEYAWILAPLAILCIGAIRALSYLKPVVKGQNPSHLT